MKKEAKVSFSEKQKRARKPLWRLLLGHWKARSELNPKVQSDWGASKTDLERKIDKHGDITKLRVVEKEKRGSKTTHRQRQNRNSRGRKTSSAIGAWAVFLSTHRQPHVGAVQQCLLPKAKCCLAVFGGDSGVHQQPNLRIASPCYGGAMRNGEPLADSYGEHSPWRPTPLIARNKGAMGTIVNSL